MAADIDFNLVICGFAVALANKERKSIIT